MGEPSFGKSSLRYTFFHEQGTLLIYDTIVIGAGITGCATAYFLANAGERVALIDKTGIAAGGSGAAGAFVSPKFTKSGPLKELMEESYRFSLAFYRENFADLIRIAPLVHFAKYDDENAKVRAFKETTSLSMLHAMPDAPLTEETDAFEHVVLAQSGLVDARGVCGRLAERSDFFVKDIDIIKYDNTLWHVGGLEARKVVLATGAYRPLVPMPHIGLRAVWGHRVDIRTATPLRCHLHQHVSIAATDGEGRGAIGATHDVHYHPDKHDDYDMERGRRELLKKAARTVRLEEVEILGDYTGLRSGSNDYYPIVGAVADAAASLESHPELGKGVRTDRAELPCHPKLYMINGTGGYGFVMGPYLGKLLAETMLRKRALPSELDPTRFLYRWARKQAQR